MKRISIWLIIALITFAVGVLAVSVWFIHTSLGDSGLLSQRGKA
jgi:flagellar basal body-associated protein FliL